MSEIQPKTAAELGLKAQSKKELYNLLQTDVGINMPPTNEANAKYISDVVSGTKKHPFNANQCIVPQRKIRHSNSGTKNQSTAY